MSLLWDLFSGMQQGFEGGMEESREDRREKRRQDQFTQGQTDLLHERDRLRRKSEEEDRARELESMLGLGESYGEVWDFKHPEAAKLYYEKSFLPEREREAKEAERFQRQQQLRGALQGQGLNAGEVEARVGLADAYPDLYRALYPQAAQEDPSRREDRLFRQRVQGVEDQLLDQIPAYFELDPEDRQSLVGQVESFNRRGITWHIGEDEGGNLVVRRGPPPPADEEDEEEELLQHTPPGALDFWSPFVEESFGSAPTQPTSKPKGKPTPKSKPKGKPKVLGVRRIN